LLFVHGYLDCGASFAPLVGQLPDHYHCVAPDLRGHGGTEWVGKGGYYHFLDYVRDLRDLVDQLAGPRLVLIGHSMGGGIATLFAGSWPDAVEKLVLLEGLGPPEEDYEEGPERIRRWLRELRNTESRAARTFETIEQVAGRLGKLWSTLSSEQTLELARWMSCPAEGGGLRWSYDPMHRTRTPMIFRPQRWAPFLRAITCPTLTVTGGQSWYRWPDLEGRRANLVNRTHCHIENGSHMLHLDSAEVVGSAILRHIDAHTG
jgi:pimeloyl-ACP methyl ester carboxylesterase